MSPSTTRSHLTKRLEENLRCLQTDYVDLYLLHHRDPDTPPAAIAEVMQDLTQAGKIRYWGVSNHTAAEVANFSMSRPSPVSKTITISPAAIATSRAARVRLSTKRK